MAEVWTSNLTKIPEYRLQIIQEQAAFSGVSVHQVSQALEGFIKGKTLSYLHNKESRSGIPIRLIVPREQRITPDMLATAFVKNNKGKAIPLSRLITIIEGEQPHPILHQDMKQIIQNVYKEPAILSN